MSDWIALARPVAAVLAVVVRGADVLLVRRSNRPDAGLWGFPGGKIEGGEPVAADAAEEAGWFAVAGLPAMAPACSEGVLALAERALSLSGLG